MAGKDAMVLAARFLPSGPAGSVASGSLDLLPASRRGWMDRGTGVVLIGFGLRLALEP
jgi:threonine/homoserine/homoserine lactone efflux protein